jgi:hypothetical protein
MKRFTISGLMTACVFALSVTALAQEYKPPAQDKPAAKEHTMTGCLQKGTVPDTFIVTSTAEKGPKVIGIITAKPNLAPHVGHKIDITGTAVDVKTAESSKPAPSKADHYMNITAIKMVSATCP